MIIFFLFVLLILNTFTLPQLVKAQEEEVTCPANSSFSSGQCLCNSGYVSSGGNCVTEAVACAPYGPSHLVGNDCVCIDGYGILSGSSKCVSLSAACAQYNAIWSSAKGDCVCASGTHEDAASGKCVADAPVTAPTPTPAPAPTPVSPEPTPAPTPTPISVPAATDNLASEPTNTAPAIEVNPFAQVDSLMETKYQNLSPAVQTVIEENKKILSDLSEQTYSPQIDLIAVLDQKTTAPLVNETILKSLTVAPPSNLFDIKAQQTVLENFSDQAASEVEIKGEEIVPKLHEAFVRQNFPQELKDWQKQFDEAKKDKKLKAGVSTKELEDGMEMENRLKWQIAELQKIVGYNHLRCLEATKALQFDTMSKDYKQYFNGQSADNMFEEAAEGQAFSGAAKNASAGATQLRELKEQLKRQYPADWQLRYYDVSAKPDLNKELRQTENIFKVFEKLKK